MLLARAEERQEHEHVLLARAALLEQSMTRRLTLVEYLEGGVPPESTCYSGIFPASKWPFSVRELFDRAIGRHQFNERNDCDYEALLARPDDLQKIIWRLIEAGVGCEDMLECLRQRCLTEEMLALDGVTLRGDADGSSLLSSGDKLTSSPFQLDLSPCRDKNRTTDEGGCDEDGGGNSEEAHRVAAGDDDAAPSPSPHATGQPLYTNELLSGMGPPPAIGGGAQNSHHPAGPTRESGQKTGAGCRGQST